MTKIIFILSLIALVAILPSKAQTSGSNSPYSRYGWGNLSEEAQGFNKGMAGTGLGARGRSILNYQNPASYSAIDSITFLFDAGISLQRGHWSENGKKVNALNSTLDYLQAGFRLRKNLGISIGIRPISIVGYDFYSTQQMDNNDGFGEYTCTSSYQGNGGTHETWLGAGWAPFKNLSFGIRGGYIWGNFEHNSSITYSNSNVHSLARLYKGNINTYSINGGIQYSTTLPDKNELTIGGVIGIGHKIDCRSTFINQKKSQSQTLPIGADTLTAGNAFQLPLSYGVGFTFRHNKKWTIGADYSCQFWKKCMFPEVNETPQGSFIYSAEKNTFRNRHKISLGAEYIPNPEGLKVRHHVAYRAGVSYASSYINQNGGKGPRTYLVSAGMELPIVNIYNNRSVLNVSVQWEHLAPVRSNSLKEDNLRLCLGITFNAHWFNKWRIE